ncbi:MAG TPA: LytTR family DNA-binding domain-containing protein [Flavobacteriaceae bacterium]|nr:LytTR family DNA-binding domain-containing protein [Flavobacteriaceae bacterium]
MTKSELKCIIVDDSPLQCLIIGQLVKNHPALVLVHQFSNAVGAKEFLKTNSVDLVFLDIEMPLLSGFDLLDNLENPPGIIFVTGKTQYAFEAFNYEAIDFLQKPVDNKRFDRAIDKALMYIALKEMDSDKQNYIFVKSNLKKHKVFVHTILYVEAMGDYAKIVTEDNEYTVLTTMKAFEKRVPQDLFLRIHKSYIVNLAKVKKFGSKFVELEDEKLPLSRHKKKRLQEALMNISSADKVSTDPQLQQF